MWLFIKEPGLAGPKLPLQYFRTIAMCSVSFHYLACKGWSSDIDCTSGQRSLALTLRFLVLKEPITTVPYPSVTTEVGVFCNSDDKKISTGSTFER
jgi:hypothetical protein